MNRELLELNNISVDIEEKQILKQINMTIKKGETHVLMGPNGAGKSTLGYALMGNPRYEISSGAMMFKGKDITDAPVEQRAKDGMFQGPQ